MCSQSCPLVVTLWTVPTRLLCPWAFPGKNTGVGCHFLHQDIFLIQGSNPHLLSLALQADSVPLSQRSPSNLSHDAFQIHSACVSVGHGEFKTPKPQSPVRNRENRWDESERLLALPEGGPFTEPCPLPAPASLSFLTSCSMDEPFPLALK